MPTKPSDAGCIVATISDPSISDGVGNQVAEGLTHPSRIGNSEAGVTLDLDRPPDGGPHRLQDLSLCLQVHRYPGHLEIADLSPRCHQKILHDVGQLVPLVGDLGKDPLPLVRVDLGGADASPSLIGALRESEVAATRPNPGDSLERKP